MVSAFTSLNLNSHNILSLPNNAHTPSYSSRISVVASAMAATLAAISATLAPITVMVGALRRHAVPAVIPALLSARMRMRLP